MHIVKVPTQQELAVMPRAGSKSYWNSRREVQVLFLAAGCHTSLTGGKALSAHTRNYSVCCQAPRPQSCGRLSFCTALRTTFSSSAEHPHCALPRNAPSCHPQPLDLTATLLSAHPPETMDILGHVAGSWGTMSRRTARCPPPSPVAVVRVGVPQVVPSGIHKGIHGIDLSPRGCLTPERQRRREAIFS